MERHRDLAATPCRTDKRTIAVASVLCLAAALLTLSACGGGDANDRVNAAEQEVDGTTELRTWPELAVEWAEAMQYGVRELDGAVRMRDEAAVDAWIANLASCSLRMPPDPGAPTLEDVMSPGPGSTGHVEAIGVYGLVESACRNYEAAAQHLEAGFDPVNVHSGATEVEIGLTYLRSVPGIMQAIANEIERVWGLRVSDTAGPSADLGQDGEAFEAGEAVGEQLVAETADGLVGGAVTQLEILARCYEARGEHGDGETEAPNPVSWGRGCRAGVEDAIADLGIASGS